MTYGGSLRPVRPTDDTESTRGRVSLGGWVRWYGGTLVLITGISFATAALFHVHPWRCAFVYLGLFFLAASVDRPRAAFLMLRNTGWFAYIREDFIVRWITVIAGIWMLGLAIFLPAFRN